MTDATAEIAQRVRAALDATDLEAFADLLDPRVTWGAPGDPAPPCQNREQVLAWYRQGRADGRRADVLDVTGQRDKILVSMTVTDRHPTPDQPGANRWQVLTIVDGRITDIHGYDNESDAVSAAGFPADPASYAAGGSRAAAVLPAGGCGRRGSRTPACPSSPLSLGVNRPIRRRPMRCRPERPTPVHDQPRFDVRRCHRACCGARARRTRRREPSRRHARSTDGTRSPVTRASSLGSAARLSVSATRSSRSSDDDALGDGAHRPVSAGGFALDGQLPTTAVGFATGTDADTRVDQAAALRAGHFHAAEASLRAAGQAVLGATCLAI